MLEYLPRQWNRTNSTDGDITSYTISTSTDGVTFSQVASGSWAGNGTTKSAQWPARNVGFVRLQVTAGTDGYANVGGLHIGGRTAKPALVSRPFPAPGTSYRLVARHSGKVADVTGRGTADGTDIAQRAWNGGANQKWTFTSTGDGYYTIRSADSGKLMEVAGVSRTDGGNVSLWQDANAPQQQWAVTPVAAGYYLLTNRLSGLALNVSGGSVDDGANIDQWTYYSTVQQQWQITPA